MCNTTSVVRHCYYLQQPTMEPSMRAKAAKTNHKHHHHHGFQRLAFADRLRERRLAVGLTQDELAARCGATGGAIGHYETGFALPSVDRLAAISTALEYPADTLLHGAPRQPRNASAVLTPDERELLADYRRMTFEQQAVTRALVDAAVRALQLTARGPRRRA